MEKAVLKGPGNRGWETPPRAPACARCTRPFQPLEACTTRLTASGISLERSDFCPPCWEAEPKDAAALFWRSRVPEPKARRELFDAAELFEAFKRIVEEADPSRNRLGYLLALYCTRKRLLRLNGIEREGGEERLLFVTPRTRQAYRVPSVEMGPAEMAAARDELSRLSAESPR